MAAQLRYWVDYSSNHFDGAKLTLTDQDGAYLLSALSTLVTIAGGAFWSIISYIVYRRMAAKRLMDGLTAQEQLLFRNPSGALGDAFTLAQMSRKWRSQVPRGWLRPALLTVIPLAIWAGFAIAGVFVSHVTTPAYKSNRVLVAPGNCGLVQWETQSLQDDIARVNKIATDTGNARAYAEQCYHSQSGALNCNELPVQSLNYNTSIVACPWSGDLCVGHSAFQMDSGWIDSHNDLGINAKLKNRVQVRLVNTCAVINTTGLVRSLPDPTTDGESNFLEFYLGSVPTVSNYTYRYSTHTVHALIPYTLVAVYSYANDNGTVDLIPPLRSSEADTSLIFLAQNSVNYYSATTDPFFLATGATLGPTGLIRPDNFVNVMGCLDQRQYREPNSNATTLLTGVNRTGFQDLFTNEQQKATAERIDLALLLSDTYNNVAGQNEAALKATGKIYQLFSAGLPSNQSQIELAGWFETGLSKIQHYIADYVTNAWAGNPDLSSHITVDPPANWKEGDRPALKSQCQSQLARSLGGYQTFSFWGVLITVVGSVLIILTSLALSPIVRCCRWASRENTNAEIAFGKINVLRMALEGRGYDGWQNTDSDVPVRPATEADIHAPTLENGHLLIPTVEVELRPQESGVEGQGGQEVNGSAQAGLRPEDTDTSTQSLLRADRENAPLPNQVAWARDLA